VFYGSRLLEHFAAMNPDGAEDLFLKAIQAKQKQPGVFVHGRVSQDVLADEMLRSGVWVHPSTMPVGEAFFETSCIGSAEAQAAGLAVVYRPVGALTETVRSGIPTEIENLAANISYALRAVHNRALIQAGISDFTWDSVAEQWSKWIEADMSKNVRDIPKKDNKTVIHMVLAPRASGGMVIDAAAPGNVAHGGGCRAGFMGLAASLPALGYKVRAFSTFDDVMVERDGVEYVRLDHMRRFPKPDVLLAYYDTSPLVEQTGMLRIASHHTYTPYANFDWADVNTAPSTRAREHLRARYEPCGEWQTLPNGVQISLPRTPVSGRVIYHTSPDRGLHILLAVWPEVRKRVPHATLHVVGNVLEAIAPADMEYLRPQLRRRATLLRDGLAAAQAAGGVELLGRLTREALDKELSEASAFAFPCSVSEPCETFSISIMECLAIGMPVVLAPADALGDIYAGALEMTPAPIEDHVQEFTDALVKTLLEPSQTLVDAGKALAAKHSFENKAKTLDMIIRQYRSDSVV
jgi:glycosyltransferase involved in cell wall biosynthesis